LLFSLFQCFPSPWPFLDLSLSLRCACPPFIG
jgi:hypothetical protein